MTGTVAANGRIHFVLSEYVDASIPLASPPATTISGVPLLDISRMPGRPTRNITNNGAQITSSVVSQSAERFGLSLHPDEASHTGTQPAQFFTATPGTQPFSDGTVMWQCYSPKPRIIVSLATSTGRITTSPVNPLDKFSYAEIGEVTQ